MNNNEKRYLIKTIQKKFLKKKAKGKVDKIKNNLNQLFC